MRLPHLEHYVSPASLPTIRTVETVRPWFWLAAAWGDFSKAPAVSLTYGVVVAGVFDLITLQLAASGGYDWAIGIMSGFVLLAPIIAVGLYEISRRLEGELPVGLMDSLHGWRRNAGSTLAIGVIMVLLLLTWFMLSLQTTAVLVGYAGSLWSLYGGASSLGAFIGSITWPMVAGFVVIGLVAAVVSFLFTAVSVPMLTDHEDMDVITAVVVSVHAVVQNWRPMLLWAGIIVGFTAISVIPLYLGLVVTFPLLAYATWHGYREIIGE